MKTPSGSSWFVAVGASAIVFIGAFVHFDPVAPSSPLIPPPAKIVTTEKVAPEPALEPPFRGDSSPAMAEVIRLAESHVEPGVILAFVQNSGQTYSPTADEILYLSHLGVPQDVIAALFPGQPGQSAASGVSAPAAVADAAPPQEASSNIFAEALAPYGNWVQVPDYGAAWQPGVEATNPDWKPYVDDGQWINSDSGWYWQSEYPWGWAPFHYGGWVNAAAPLGWVWVPGKTWGPAWVAWRSTQRSIGWAPLPPGVSLNVLSQLTFSGHPVTPGYDFGLAPSSYVFVRASLFLNPNLPSQLVPATRATALVASSTAMNNYSVVNNKIINGGVNRGVVAAAVKRPVPEVVLEPVSSVPDLIQGPAALLASARGQEAAGSSMQLPPLHYGPPPAGFGKHDSAGEYRTGTYDRPVLRDTWPPHPPQPQFRPAGEYRFEAPAPARDVAAAGSSNGKQTK